MNIKYLTAAAALAVGVSVSAQVVIDADMPRPVSQVVEAAPVKEPEPEPAPAPEKKAIYSDKIPLSPELQVFVRTQAELNGVPYAIALGVIEQESRFQVDEDGGDSYGLMQIHECHGPKEIIIEPHENVRIGCWLLGYHYREYKDWSMALVAYNCGEAGAYQQYFRHGSISSPYSREVMQRSERFATLLHEESVLRPR